MTVTTLLSDYQGAAILRTNEYAYNNPSDAASILDAANQWDMTSGSLFVVNGAHYSGTIDNNGASAGPRSSTYTGSAVYRQVSKISTVQNALVSMSMKLDEFDSGSSADDDGIKLWTRYQSQHDLYAAYVCRRDGVIAIKRKIPDGGPSNGGSYHTLAASAADAFNPTPGTWYSVSFRSETLGSGRVRLTVTVPGVTPLTHDDDGVTSTVDSQFYPQISAAGKTGIRADWCRFYWDSFKAETLW